MQPETFTEIWRDLLTLRENLSSAESSPCAYVLFSVVIKALYVRLHCIQGLVLLRKRGTQGPCFRVAGLHGALCRSETGHSLTPGARRRVLRDPHGRVRLLFLQQCP